MKFDFLTGNGRWRLSLAFLAPNLVEAAVDGRLYPSRRGHPARL
jgi:hypothetical protein